MLTQEENSLEEVAKNDADLEFIKGSNDYTVDVAHYSVSKVYALAFKNPEFFSAIKELKDNGMSCEPQIDFQNEKIIILATKVVNREKSE